MSRFSALWPRWAAFALLAAGLAGYVRNYPLPRTVLPLGDGSALDSLIPPSGKRRDNGLGLIEIDTALFRNPFQTRSRPGYDAGTSHSKMPSPVRRWKLKGTAGNVVATLVDSAGVKHLMRTGDSAGGVRVLDVHPSHVTMQDEAGRFELGLEK